MEVVTLARSIILCLAMAHPHNPHSRGFTGWEQVHVNAHVVTAMAWDLFVCLVCMPKGIRHSRVRRHGRDWPTHEMLSGGSVDTKRKKKRPPRSARPVCVFASERALRASKRSSGYTCNSRWTSWRERCRSGKNRSENELLPSSESIAVAANHVGACWYACEGQVGKRSTLWRWLRLARSVALCLCTAMAHP